MEETSYPPLRKMYAYLRGAESMKFSTTNTTLRLMQLRKGTIHHLNEALHDRMMPPREAGEACQQMWATCDMNRTSRGEIERLVLPTLKELWSDHGFAHLLQGQEYIKKGWDARGGGYSDTVTEQGWKGFKTNFDLAEQELRKAWSLETNDTAIPIAMITICMGQNYSRNEMEHWFKRAMEIDPACYRAVQDKAFFLEPKWHGSAEEMLEFGRECARSTRWKGNVPLILVDCHESLCRYLDKDQQPQYWLNPAVWMDLRASYERFFELNPTDISYRHNYARAAYKCGQYQVFLDQVKRFDGTNFNYFGGPEKFADMLRIAKAKTEEK